MRRLTPTLALWAIPIIFAATGVLLYYSWVAATQFHELGEQTIARNTLLLAREKVDSLESRIIDADNRAFSYIMPPDLSKGLETWRGDAESVTPSVRALLIYDLDGTLLADSIRGTSTDRQALLRVIPSAREQFDDFRELPLGRLKHVHIYRGRGSFLFTFKRVRRNGQDLVLLAQHDTGYVVREMLPALFATEDISDRYNIIDTRNRVVFGRSLSDAGSFLFGYRFPTTLYRWRLQIAPEDVTRLNRAEQNKGATQIALVGTAVTVLASGLLILAFGFIQERRSLAQRSEFVANVSHEIKTPLSVVRMYSEMLATGMVSSKDQTQKYAAQIQREAERLTALVENVLDFSALERGEQRYEFRQQKLRPVLEQAVDTFRSRATDSDPPFQISLHFIDNPTVNIDPQAILLAVLNLFENAAKHSGSREVDVRLEIVRDFLQLRVRDHGQGVTEDLLRRIFARFYRNNAPGVRGSGIGLSLVMEIARAHNGQAWARNAENGGLEITMTFPLPDDHA